MKIILLGYCALILLGAAILSLPFSSKTPGSTNFLDALFTSTSATCVTGLIRFDTFTHWTLFAQIVILCLIQIGGIGYMTIAITLVSFTKKKIGLTSRFILQDSIASPQVGGVVKMTKFIFLGSAIMEALGTLLLSFYFCPKLGFGTGLYYSLFHSVSAFCNAGFDLMGRFDKFSSLTSFVDNWYVCAVIMILIIVGGIGFFVWYDMITNKFSFRKYKLQTKLVLVVSVILIFGGALILFLFEARNPATEGWSMNRRILSSLFQSVTARTAGFNTVNLNAMSQSSKAMIIFLMLIGGSTGSTAGGMKTTTFAVLIMSVITTFRRRKSIEAFGRRLEDGVIRTSCCIFVMYIVFAFAASMIICDIEGLPFMTVLYECSSAIGTVGITLGITPFLSIPSEIIIIFLMIFGRVGSITMLLAFSSEKAAILSRLPSEKIQVG